MLTVGVTSYLASVSMALVPFFNPANRSFGEVAMAAPLAVLNVVIVAAVILLLVDLLFRALKVRALWAYALAGGLLTFGVCFGLAHGQPPSRSPPCRMTLYTLSSSSAPDADIGVQPAFGRSMEGFACNRCGHTGRRRRPRAGMRSFLGLYHGAVSRLERRIRGNQTHRRRKLTPLGRLLSENCSRAWPRSRSGCRWRWRPYRP